MSVLDRFRLDGRRLFITGGSRGLGREMALAIADAGADVVLVGRDAASLERTAADIRALGRQALTVQADMGEPAECEAACERALAEYGPYRHPDQQRRRPARTTPIARHAARALARADGPEPDQRVPLHQADRRRDGAPRPGRPDHQHRLDQRPSSPAARSAAGTTRPRRPPSSSSPARRRPTGRRTASPSNAILPGGFMTDPNLRWTARSSRGDRGLPAAHPHGRRSASPRSSAPSPSTSPATRRAS